MYRERCIIGQHETLRCDEWLFANVMLLKRSIKNESVQSNYFPRGGFINISDEMMMHTRETRKRERERDVKARAQKQGTKTHNVP